MSNPFEDPDGTYVVVRNDEHQYSIWPAAMAVPAGWDVRHGPSGRQECLDFVETNWTDMRPRSLAEWMDGTPAPGPSHT
ncbi:MbtH family protein [Micromonospora maritima]|uniref:MbtH family protein n=1 Tax=Micromonospora maritima TaxID=986711 RepID=UPI0037939501